MATATANRRNTGREIEGRDSVGLYLDEIARTPLLDAAREVELAKAIEAGLYAESLLAEGRVGRRKGGAPKQASQAELEWIAEEGRKAVTEFINANLRLALLRTPLPLYRCPSDPGEPLGDVHTGDAVDVVGQVYERLGRFASAREVRRPTVAMLRCEENYMPAIGAEKAGWYKHQGYSIPPDEYLIRVRLRGVGVERVKRIENSDRKAARPARLLADPAEEHPPARLPVQARAQPAGQGGGLPHRPSQAGTRRGLPARRGRQVHAPVHDELHVRQLDTGQRLEQLHRR